jgi:hypothetical protein
MEKIDYLLYNNFTNLHLGGKMKKGKKRGISKEYEKLNELDMKMEKKQELIKELNNILRKAGFLNNKWTFLEKI